MSTHCSRRQVASAGGLGGTDLAETRCGRRHNAKSSDGGVVGCQGGLARCGEKGSAWRGATERARTRGATRQLGRGTCNTRPLFVPRARTERAR